MDVRAGYHYDIRRADGLPANGLESAGGMPDHRSHLCSYGH